MNFKDQAVTNKFLNLFFIFMAVTVAAKNGTYMGGTVSWRESHIPGQIRFTFRMTWVEDKGPCGTSCSDIDIGKMTTGGAPFSSNKWVLSSSGLNLTLGDLNYILTSYGQSPGWEQGEKSIIFLPPANAKFSLRLHGIPWMLTSTETAQAINSIETLVDFRKRNDTKRFNASPLSALPPYIGVPYGCASQVLIPVVEPDRDMMKCRWASHKECGTACTNLPDAYLDKSSCIIHLNTTRRLGYERSRYYRTSIVVEDFPQFTIKMGNDIKTPYDSLSSIQVQFVIHVVSGSQCNTVMKYVFPTPTNNIRVSYMTLATVFRTGTYIESNVVSGVGFLASFPIRMEAHQLSDDRNRSSVTRLFQTWRPQKEQLGDQLICVWGKERNGVTSSARCVHVLILDMDECLSSPCQQGGTCINLFRRFTCDCPHGFMPPTCSRNLTCSGSPCLNNGTCLNSNASYTCQCQVGYTGDRCQMEANPCASRPCSNGGVCHASKLTYTCLCPATFTGIACQTQIQKKKNGTQLQMTIQNVIPETPWIILASILSGILGLVLVGGCCVWFIGKVCQPTSIRDEPPPPVNNQRVKQQRPMPSQSDRNLRSHFLGGAEVGSVPALPMVSTANQPKPINIYRTSIGDPLMHKCGK